MEYLEENDEIKSKIISYIDYNLENISKPFAAFFKKEYGLTLHQMSVIWYLRKTDDMSMSQCAEKLHVTKQQATQLVDNLVKKQLINRVHLESNRRIIKIELTEKGIQVIKEVENRYIKKFIDETDKLKKKEIEEFLNAIEVINRILPRLDFKP